MKGSPLQHFQPGLCLHPQRLVNCGAVIYWVDFRRVAIRGGTDEERLRAERWARDFLTCRELPENERPKVWLVEGGRSIRR